MRWVLQYQGQMYHNKLVKDKGKMYYFYVLVKLLLLTFVSGLFQGFQVQDVKGLNHFIEFTHTSILSRFHFRRDFPKRTIEFSQ